MSFGALYSNDFKQCSILAQWHRHSYCVYERWSLDIGSAVFTVGSLINVLETGLAWKRWKTGSPVHWRKLVDV